MKKIITRKEIISRIDGLIENKVSISDFGEEMIRYLTFDDKYEFEQGYEDIIEKVLDEFMEMHDADKGDVGYTPYVPTRERLIQIKEMLTKGSSYGKSSNPPK